MVTIKSNKIRTFDVDKCLVRELEDNDIGKETVFVKDPLKGPDIRVRINKAMIRLLKEEKHRGGYIFVWSRGGHEWAANVVDALGLRPYVNIAMDKPEVYFDDTPVQEWLKDRVFLDFDFKYKE